MAGALMPLSVKFPEPGGYVKYWDSVSHELRFEYLAVRGTPFKYPFRLPTASPGSKTPGNPFQFQDLQPFEQTGNSNMPIHRFHCFIGVSKGAKFYVYFPSNFQTSKFDQAPEDIQQDQEGDIEYGDSPYDAPSRGLWVKYNNLPAIQALVTNFQSCAPSVLIIAAKYLVTPNELLDPGVLLKLRNGQLPSMPVDAGGQW